MSQIFSVNVGANASHGGIARSPVFEDGRFVYVPFPTTNKLHTQVYPDAARPYVRDPNRYRTHADPDWVNLTYGDYCLNPRAASLRRVSRGDILLFWGLLWRNRGSCWSDFTGERGWYVLGALRVAEVLQGGNSVESLTRPTQERARLNAHLSGEKHLAENHYIFIGDLNRSRLLTHAVSLGVLDRDGLLYRAFTTAVGEPLSLRGSPPWYCSLRSCRPVWDLDRDGDRTRALLVAKAILELNDFDLLGGL